MFSNEARENDAMAINVIECLAHTTTASVTFCNYLLVCGRIVHIFKSQYTNTTSHDAWQMHNQTVK